MEFKRTLVPQTPGNQTFKSIFKKKSDIFQKMFGGKSKSNIDYFAVIYSLIVHTASLMMIMLHVFPFLSPVNELKKWASLV